MSVQREEGTLDVELEADVELSDNEGPEELIRGANDNLLANMDVEAAIDNNFLMPVQPGMKLSSNVSSSVVQEEFSFAVD